MKLSHYQPSSTPNFSITNSCTFHFDSFSIAQGILLPIIHDINNLSVFLYLFKEFDVYGRCEIIGLIVKLS